MWGEKSPRKYLFHFIKQISLMQSQGGFLQEMHSQLKKVIDDKKENFRVNIRRKNVQESMNNKRLQLLNAHSERQEGSTVLRAD